MDNKKIETYAKEYVLRQHSDVSNEQAFDIYNAFIAGYVKNNSIKEKRKSTKSIYEKIVDIVLDYYDISITTAKDKTRKREVVQARQICFYFGEKYTQLSLEKIGSEFGKSHCTVLHSKQNIINLIDTDKQINLDIKILESKIKQITL